MKTRFKHSINKIAIYLAIGSFAVGTLLLLLSFIGKPDALMVTGLYYTMFAALINAIMLIILIVNSITHSKDYIENFGTIFILLLNIPITMYYMELAFRSPF